MKINALIFNFLFCFTAVFSQQNITTDSIQPRLASIVYATKGDSLSLNAKTPPLQQIAGAPKAFYTYYWELGDGNYSKKKTPKHVYKNKGNYEVKLWVTNNYDTGKPPVSRPERVKIIKDADDYQDKAAMTEDFTLQRNREPVPDQDMVVIMSYKNENDFTSDGKLFLFYNEHKYTADNFELTDMRTHHGEKEVFNDGVVYKNPKDNFDVILLASAENEMLQVYQNLQDSTKKTDLNLTLKEASTYYCMVFGSFDIF